MPFPFDRYTVRVMSVERPTPKLEKHLLNHGYAFVRANGNYGDCTYAHVASVGEKAIAAQRKGDYCTWDMTKYWGG